MKTQIIALLIDLAGVSILFSAGCVHRFHEPKPIGGSMESFLRQRDAEARIEALEHDEQLNSIQKH